MSNDNPLLQIVCQILAYQSQDGPCSCQVQRAPITGPWGMASESVGTVFKNADSSSSDVRGYMWGLENALFNFLLKYNML